MKTRLTFLPLVFLLILAGCKSIGPGALTRDRYEYSDSIGESWKRQTLLNIIKLRYLDPPIFVDVGQIVASRSLSRNVSAFGNSSAYNNGPPPGAILGNFGVSAGGTYIDQPTVTYTPLTGNKFIKSLMTPLTPDSVFFMIQSGWPADAVLLMSTSAINGLKNQTTSANGTTLADPEFMQVIALMRKIQLAGGVAFRVVQDAQKQESSLLTFRRSDIAPEVLADAGELRRLLKLNQDANEFQLTFGAQAVNDKEVALQTRSIIQLMGVMSAQVDVPAKDLANHAAAPGWESAANATTTGRLVQIHSSESEPAHAFVAVPYRGHWFWIDDYDLRTKRVFSFMMLLFTLADTGEPQPAPVVTIPAH